MRKPLISKAFRRVALALGIALLIALLLTLWIISVRWVLAPDGSERLHLVRRSLVGVDRGSHVVIDVVDNDERPLTLMAHVVAKGGDVVHLDGGYLKVNDEIVNDGYDAQCTFVISKDVTYKVLHSMERALGVKLKECDTIAFPLRKIKEDWKYYLRVAVLKNMPDVRLYPYRKEVMWNAYNWGPMRLPRKGDEVVMDLKNSIIYGPMIKRYEGADIVADGSTYVFKEDYVWLLDADRDKCIDSRYFGPVPESRVVGRTAARLW